MNGEKIQWKYIFKGHLISTVIIYAFAYMCNSFIYWNFGNPFQWIIDLPENHDNGRSGILLIYIIYTVVSLMVHYNREESRINNGWKGGT